MADIPPLQRIQLAVRQGAYRLSVHAERERDADGITITELEEAFGGEKGEVLEEYPDDPRGYSVLVLGFTRVRSPVHSVIGLFMTELIFVTVYRPDPKKWYDWRRRV